MADNQQKVSEVATANTMATTDKVVILYNAANTTTRSVRTITRENFLKALVSSLPVYANNSVAFGSLAVGDVYQTANGELRIVVNE